MTLSENVIEVQGLNTAFGANVIHDGLSLSVRRGEIMAVVGGSGTGKSVLLSVLTGLLVPRSGSIRLLGEDWAALSGRARRALRARTGMLFQDGALFGALTVAQNIQVPLRTRHRLRPGLMAELAGLKLALVGLPAAAGARFPAELSGGMRKRAGLARALALDPEILFLDEPTAGLDPIAAASFDELIRSLQSALGLTVVMITHDLDTLGRTADRIAVLVGRTITIGTLGELRAHPDPWIQAYFAGPRGRAAAAAMREPS